MYNRLYQYIVKNNILFPTQHGFQSGNSPYMSLLNMQDKIGNTVENNEYSLGVFFYLAKGNLCFVTIEVCCHPLTMISSVMYPRFIHITLEIPQSIAAFLLAQTHGGYPLDSWEFQYWKKFHSQFACLRTLTFLKGNYAHTSLVKL